MVIGPDDAAEAVFVDVFVDELGKTVRAPAHWSYNAVRIFADKYFCTRDLSDISMAVRRVTIGVAEGDKVLADYLYDGIIAQRFAFNSPVFFNVGVEENPQCSACFILPVEDDMDGIMDLAKTESALFKYGSGAGSNLSNIRGSSEGISGGGKASGPVSFMKVFDSVAKVVKSGGKTRRAAKMQILDANHPDILEFIQCKVREERKAKDLIEKAGYPATFEGEAYDSVFFQNSNLSVRVTDDFMVKERDSKTYNLIERTTGNYAATINTRDVLQYVAEAAWECGDPGIQFHDTINKWHTCPSAGPLTASNPCSEFMFLDNTSCNLASLNLHAYLLSSGEFNIELFQKDVRMLVIAMDNIVSLAGYPTPEIASRTQAYRPLGLGFTNLGYFLIRKGLDYSSIDARNLAADITALMHFTAYEQSAQLANERGAYSAYVMSDQMAVLKRHGSYLPIWGASPMCIAANVAYTRALEMGSAYGFRNSQLTVIAPTGTISFIMDAVTTGIEPLFATNATKKMVDGTTIRVGVDLHNVETASDISPENHVDMMAACQPFISGAISKTINMPNSATVEDIMSIYRYAWNHNVKSLAVYRDGSKLLQPMNAATKTPATEQPKSVSTRHPLPGTRDAVTHKFSVAGHDGYLTVGKYPDGTPGEIFIQISKEGSTISGLLDSWAITVSIALQYGVPLSAIVDKLEYTRFEPSGFTGNEQIPMAHSIIDYVCRWLILNTGKEPETVSAYLVDGTCCPDCGAELQRTGTCFACSNCGYTGGCG